MKASSEAVVLLVDDDEQLRGLLQCLLQADGYCVVGAANGEEGLDASRRFTDRIVLITDINMSRMSGVELSDRIRQERPGTPVLFISGDPGSAEDTAVRSHLLMKPFKPEEFLSRVRHLAGQCGPGAAARFDAAVSGVR